MILPVQLEPEADELRWALIRSILLTPDAVDEREPVWIAYFNARHGVPA